MCHIEYVAGSITNFSQAHHTGQRPTRTTTNTMECAGRMRYWFMSCQRVTRLTHRPFPCALASVRCLKARTRFAIIFHERRERGNRLFSLVPQKIANAPAQPPLPEGSLDEATKDGDYHNTRKKHTGNGRLQQIVSNSVVIQGNTSLLLVKYYVPV